MNIVNPYLVDWPLGGRVLLHLDSLYCVVYYNDPRWKTRQTAEDKDVHLGIIPTSEFSRNSLFYAGIREASSKTVPLMYTDGLVNTTGGYP